MRPTESVTRRQVLAAGAVASVATAGCAGVINQVASQLLEEVNILNDTDQERSGQIVVRSNGESNLDSEFTVPGAESSNSNGNNSNGNDSSNIRTYADVWAGSGAYEIEVSLDEPVDGESTVAETVSIDNTDEEMVLVGLGLQDADRPIEVRVGTSFTDVVEG